MKKTTKKHIRLMAASLIGLMLLSYGLLAMTLDTESNPIINYICIGAVSYTHLTLPTTPYV